MKKITLITFFFLLGLSGWALGASPESYLPLTEGLVWEYQNKFFDLKSRDQIAQAKAIKKNLAATELQGTRVVPQVFSSYQPDNVLRQETRSFIAKDSAGFYVFARQAGPDKKPEITATKYYILKFPLTKGASWQQEAEGFTLQDTIEATDASVQVPGGTFNNCLLVKKLYVNPKNPGKPMQEALFWFAPEVGNVKVVIKNFQENKEMVQELVSFKK